MTWKDVSLADYEVLREDPTVEGLIRYYKGVDVNDLFIDEYVEALAAVKPLTQPIPKVPLATDYTLNGQKYILKIDLGTFTAGQYIDAMNFIKNDAMDFRSLLTVFLIPEGHNYNDGYDMSKVKGDLGLLRMDDVSAISSFFARWSARYIKVILRYLRRELKKAGLTEQERDMMKHHLKDAEAIATAFSLIC